MAVQEFERRYRYTREDRIGGGGFGEVYKASTLLSYLYYRQVKPTPNLA